MLSSADRTENRVPLHKYCCSFGPKLIDCYIIFGADDATEIKKGLYATFEVFTLNDSLIISCIWSLGTKQQMSLKL